MRKKGDIWTQEELDILTNGMPTREQAELLPGRTKASIQQKKDAIRREGANASTKKNWSEKELAILSNGKTSKQQADMLPGRSIAAIDCKKKALRLEKASASKTRDPDAYDGRPVRPYQFISTKEATPARIKEWGRLNQEEKRAMQTV